MSDARDVKWFLSDKGCKPDNTAPAQLVVLLGYGPVSGAVVDAALDQTKLNTGSKTMFVVAGGVKMVDTPLFNALMEPMTKAGYPSVNKGETEADYMARMLESRGIPPGNIILRQTLNLQDHVAKVAQLATSLSCKPTFIAMGPSARIAAAEAAINDMPDAPVVAAWPEKIGISLANWSKDSQVAGFIKGLFGWFVSNDRYSRFTGPATPANPAGSGPTVGKLAL